MAEVRAGQHRTFTIVATSPPGSPVSGADVLLLQGTEGELFLVDLGERSVMGPIDVDVLCRFVFFGDLPAGEPAAFDVPAVGWRVSEAPEHLRPRRR